MIPRNDEVARGSRRRLAFEFDQHVPLSRGKSRFEILLCEGPLGAALLLPVCLHLDTHRPAGFGVDGEHISSSDAFSRKRSRPIELGKDGADKMLSGRPTELHVPRHIVTPLRSPTPISAVGGYVVLIQSCRQACPSGQGDETS